MVALDSEYLEGSDKKRQLSHQLFDQPMNLTLNKEGFPCGQSFSESDSGSAHQDCREVQVAAVFGQLLALREMLGRAHSLQRNQRFDVKPGAIKAVKSSCHRSL